MSAAEKQSAESYVTLFVGETSCRGVFNCLIEDGRDGKSYVGVGPEGSERLEFSRDK